MRILTLNAGSSSVKARLYQFDGHDWHEEMHYHLSQLNESPRVRWQWDKQTPNTQLLSWQGMPLETRHRAALSQIIGLITDAGLEHQLDAVCHRVVHGGRFYNAPVCIDDAVLANLETLESLAPLHQPYNLNLVRLAREQLPDIRQIACFDTMFHAEQPRMAQLHAIPRRYLDQGILRYGFHGLSYEYVFERLQSLAPRQADGRVIICHLGAGASMCAIRQGQSYDTTMGFTALEGLPMGTRCGHIDPGVLIHLMREEGWSPDQLERFLYKECGWLGLSGISSDMQELHDADTPEAEEAIAYFVHACVQQIGSLMATMRGLDAIVFTAGVGENDARIRARVLDSIQWLGVDWDAAANEQNRQSLHKPTSKIGVWVIPTNEELMLAEHGRRLLSSGSVSPLR
ncbi:acetate/propionate family kinase [Pokkaliibacter sp. CJK22405]|uniref:acetate/propionate family kinase n=1 Tax=Pokkaliibacter sp. CJK22405 TaxID=3384615 RepID=UPI003984C53F